MIKTAKQSGFTTVELLVTLFVAAIFLMSGYQLYAMIIKNNGEASARAKATNVAYQYLQTYKTDTTAVKNPCSVSSYYNPTGLNIDTSGLSNPSITISVSCPYTTSTPAITSISKLTVTVSYIYAGITQQITNATYVNKQ